MNPLFIAPIFDLFKQVLSGIGLDPEAKARAQTQAFEVLTNGSFAEKAGQALALAQVDVNKAEAQAGTFRGGWRPFIGWTCGAALAVQFVAGPLLEWGCAAAGHQVPPLPKLDGVLWELLAGMLGLGALRTLEKVKGAA
jgi:hypothetical protein